MRAQVSNFGLAHHTEFFDAERTAKSHWDCIWDVRAYLVEHAIRLVVFNTGGGNHTRDICLVAPRGMKLVGIVHHTHKLRGSFTQFLISFRMRKAFVLNDYLLDSVPQSKRQAFTSTYLIYREPVRISAVEKKSGELWVGIPGEVDFRRRAYSDLLNELKHSDLHPSIRFLLLGRCAKEGDGAQLRKLIDAGGLEKHFLLFDNFLDSDTFLGYLTKCDLLAPLVHPTIEFFNFYRRHQISGTYNLGFGFAKPLLMHEATRGPEDFETTCLFAEEGKLIALLNRLAENREELERKAASMQSNPKFAFEVQREKYISFLET